MTDTRVHPDGSAVALLTVQIEKEIVTQIRESTSAMTWNLIEADFENYFSFDKRPYFNQRAIDAQACIAVIDFDKDFKLALDTAEFLRGSFYHKIAIIALSSSINPDLLLSAMRAGCSEFLGKPFSNDEFGDTLKHLHHRWSAIMAHPSDAGKVLSIFGAKDGVGSTTLAVHLAMFLEKDLKQRVLLVDNHPQLGHVALYLGLDGNHHTFHELVQNVSRLDQELLRGFIATHPSGLDILSSPDVYGSERNTDTEDVERTVEFLCSQYDFVILDCEAAFDDINFAIIDLSNWVYLIATPEIGAIRDLSRYVDGLIQNEHVTDKLQVVINRYSSSEAVTIEQIEKAIRLPISFKIPNDYFEVITAINTGQPVPSERKSDFSRQMMKWAASLVTENNASIISPVKRWYALW
jgi:pilus assembly protein CpaE